MYMKRMRKFLSLFLVFCLNAGIMAGVRPVSAADGTAPPQVFLPGNTAQMLAWWTLDSQTQRSDGTWYGADQLISRLTINQSVTVVGDGAVGSAYGFNGTNNFVKVNNGFSNVSQITPTTFLHPSLPAVSVAFWFRPKSLTGQQILYEQGGNSGGIAVGIDAGVLKTAVSTGAAAASAGTTTQVSATQLTSDELNTWMHVAVTFSAGTAKAYVNGSLVSTVSGLGAVIPQTLDCTELGAHTVNTDADALGWTAADYYNGDLDDLRIYNVAVVPVAAKPASGTRVNLQCADQKNFYIANAAGTGTLSVASRVAADSREWVKVPGLADVNGVSFEFAATSQYLTVSSAGAVTLGTPESDADNQAATFYNADALSVPGWGQADASDFHSYLTYDKSKYLLHQSDLSLTAAAVSTDAQKASATFKDTGDQTAVLTGLRGAIYYPSYAYNAPQFWRYYDPAIIGRDMKYARSVGINAYRIWVSYEYWQENPSHFKACYDDFLTQAAANGIKVMVSLFEGNDNSRLYGTADETSRNYSSAYCVTSPSPAVCADTSLWSGPESFVDWYFANYKNDSRQMAIEIFNEPWGDARTALAKDLLARAVAEQGSVPVTLGTTDGEYDWATDLGVDMIQYHDNFPASVQAFTDNANSKISMGAQDNLPVYCTEVQRVTLQTQPSYASLAPACNTLTAGGKWAPFYWSLMVHPCYLDSYRNISLINGLFQEDGSVYSLADTQGVANDPTLGSALSLTQDSTSPYAQYQYKDLFSDNFTDSASSKWTKQSGAWSVDNGVFSSAGAGTALADLTDFGSFVLTADVSVGSAPAGLLFRVRKSDSGISGYKVTLDPSGKITLWKLTAGSGPVALSSHDKIITAGTFYTVRVETDNDNINVYLNGALALETADPDSITDGQIGLAADGAASFRNLLINARAAKTAVPKSTVTSVAALTALNVANGTAAGTISFPTNASVTVTNAAGDTTPLTLTVGAWTCSGYDAGTPGTYLFTAPLTGLPDTVTNPDALQAQIEVNVAAAATGSSVPSSSTPSSSTPSSSTPSSSTPSSSTPSSSTPSSSTAPSSTPSGSGVSTPSSEAVSPGSGSAASSADSESSEFMARSASASPAASASAAVPNTGDSGPGAAAAVALCTLLAVGFVAWKKRRV